MRKLTGFFFGVFVLTSVPAAASGIVLSHPATTVSRADMDRCSLELSLGNHGFIGEKKNAFVSPAANDRWESGATDHWNAGTNRAVDHFFMPPDQVQVRVTQTDDDVRGQSESNEGPNATLAAFEVVIH